MQCPVCGKSGVAEPAEKCPQCSSDLESFRLLDGLGEKEARLGNMESRLLPFWAQLGLLMAFAAIVAVIFYHVVFVRDLKLRQMERDAASPPITSAHEKAVAGLADAVLMFTSFFRDLKERDETLKARFDELYSKVAAIEKGLDIKTADAVRMSRRKADSP